MTARPRSVLTTALLLLLLVVPLAASGSPLTPLPAWGTEPSPNAGFPRNSLTAVDAVSAGDAWAVGHYEANGSNHPRPLVEHWNGSEWSSVTVPWNQEGELFGVATLASDDVWTVGGFQEGGQALIAHWNGSAFSLVPHPNPGTFNRLYAITAMAPNDIWAVGEFTNPISRTLALHWNGSSWTHVPTPTGDGYSHLYGVTALAPDDVWAVGDDGNRTLAIHWDGSQWTRVLTPSPGFSADLRAVSASPDGTVWAVGDSGSTSLAMRWTGAAWELVPSPSPGSNFLDLNGVSSISATDAWAVGVYDVNGNWRTLTLHWDGSSWAVVSSPSPDPTLNVLAGVTTIGSSVFAVGHAGDTGSLALRRNGSTWQRLQTANEGTGENVLNGISARAHNDIWAVGHAEDRSLTMRYNGSAWTVVPSPNLEYGVRLEGVVAITPNDAWAVGWSGSASSLDYENVAMHWDGTRWTIVPTPQPGGQLVDRLWAIDAVSSNNVWAVGSYMVDQLEDRSLILHWNGSAWSVVDHNCHTYWGLTGVTFLSATDAWAVGDATTCRYNGSTWNEVASPQPRHEHYEIAYPLEDVSGTASNDVWAVGARIIDGPYYLSWDAIVEHWNGTEWTIDFTAPGQVLYGVEAVSASDVWAVGTNSYGPLIVHNDGSGWSTVPTPEWGRGGRLAGIDSAVPVPGLTSRDDVPRSRSLWAAGNYFPGRVVSRSLIQRAPSPTQGAVFGGSNVGNATISWFGPENGSTETDPFGDYEVGGLIAGTYTFTATYPGCTPVSTGVTVVAGQTLRRDFQIDCGRAPGRPRAGPKRAR